MGFQEATQGMNALTKNLDEAAAYVRSLEGSADHFRYKPDPIDAGRAVIPFQNVMMLALILSGLTRMQSTGMGSNRMDDEGNVFNDPLTSGQYGG